MSTYKPQVLLFDEPYYVKDFGTLNAANGLVKLDSAGLVPTANLPSSIVAGLTFIGQWNASTNSPSLTEGEFKQGQYYRVSVAGSTSLSGISDWKVGDWAIRETSNWSKVDNSETVTSVQGYTGDVTLHFNDFQDASLDLIQTSQLADAAVTENKIADANVSTAKLAALCVSTDKVTDQAITASKIASSAVTEDKLESSAVSTTKIAAAAVTSAKLAASSVETAKLADQSVTKDKISLRLGNVRLDPLFPCAALSTTGDMKVSTKMINGEVYYSFKPADSTSASFKIEGRLTFGDDFKRFPDAILDPDQYGTANYTSFFRYQASAGWAFNYTVAGDYAVLGVRATPGDRSISNPAVSSSDGVEKYITFQFQGTASGSTSELLIGALVFRYRAQ